MRGGQILAPASHSLRQNFTSNLLPHIHTLSSVSVISSLPVGHSPPGVGVRLQCPPAARVLPQSRRPRRPLAEGTGRARAPGTRCLLPGLRR